MNKRKVGYVAGATLAAAVVALSPLAQAGTAPSATSVAAARAAVAKTVRSVTLSFPSSAKVGTNVSGTIVVADTTGASVAPVAGVMVALQEKRGNAFVTVADGVTDDSGSYVVAFTSRVNTTYRPLLEPAVGAAVPGKAVGVTSEAVVTWAARPDMDVFRGAKSTYAFRVTSEGNASGYLEYAKASAPKKWTKVKQVTVKGDVITQTISFPSAGNWLVRGTSAATSSNAAGHTSVLPITVS